MIPTVALANAGLPMAAVYLPPAWLLLIPIIGLEALVGTRRFGVSPLRALLGQAVANGFSTLIGVPLAWAILAAIELRFFMVAPDLQSHMGRAAAVTMQAPWLMPPTYRLPEALAAAVGVLTVVFYCVSVLSEYLILRRIVSTISIFDLWAWVLQANLVGYVLLLLSIASSSSPWFRTTFGWAFEPLQSASEYVMNGAIALAGLLGAPLK